MHKSADLDKKNTLWGAVINEHKAKKFDYIREVVIFHGSLSLAQLLGSFDNQVRKLGAFYTELEVSLIVFYNCK